MGSLPERPGAPPVVLDGVADPLRDPADPGLDPDAERDHRFSGIGRRHRERLRTRQPARVAGRREGRAERRRSGLPDRRRRLE